MNWPETFLMGGYAAYVWGAYVLTLTTMGIEVFVLVRRHRKLRNTVDRASSSLDTEGGPR